MKAIILINHAATSPIAVVIIVNKITYDGFTFPDGSGLVGTFILSLSISK